MNIANDSLIPILAQFNPWWRQEAIADLPSWKRSAFQELSEWVIEPPAPRAILLSGARQVGKTTLLLQMIHALLAKGIPPANILYVTFDHPMIKLAGIEAVLTAWREREPQVVGLEYVFIDEAQTVRDLGTWIKHEVDFNKNRRIIFTGSAMPLITSGQESGVGRWHTIKLATLSFYEYLQLKSSLFDLEQEQLRKKITKFFESKYFELNKKYEPIISMPLDLEQAQSSEISNDYSKITIPSSPTVTKLPMIQSLKELFSWPQEEFYRVSELAEPYVGHFHEYLVRGGFPQTALVDNITQAQRLIREDIVDKVLKRDMTALFGVRLVLDLEQIFLYLCMHDSGILDINTLCKDLGINRKTVQNYIELLEASHLIYRLQPFGYGKEILRGRYKIYLADSAIAPSVLLRGKTILDNPTLLGSSVETAVFKHLYGRDYTEDVRFSYWRGAKNHEVDIIAETARHIIPFEIKYRTTIESDDFLGLIDLCKQKSIAQCYMITKSVKDFGLLHSERAPHTKIMRIPAPLLCYWLDKCELFGDQ